MSFHSKKGEIPRTMIRKSKRKIKLFNFPTIFLIRHAKNVVVTQGNFSGIPSIRLGPEGAYTVTLALPAQSTVVQLA